MVKTELNRINICLSCDENYAQYSGVVVASILANAKADDDICIYILDGNITQTSKEKILSLKSIKDCCIEFVKIDEREFEDYRKIKTHNYLSLAACYRLKLPTLLPQCNRVIYLDSDVIVCSSLRELFNINLKTNVLGGVLDIDLKRKNYNENYINSGVLLIDLDKMREGNLENKFLSYAQNNIDKITMGDQEIINSVLGNQILPINEKYNVQSECYIRRSSFTKNPTIVHFIGPKKPWQMECWSVHRDLYYKYLQITPWKLSKSELQKKLKTTKIISLLTWIKHRPLFFLQSKFWNAVKKDITTKDNTQIFVAVLLAGFGDIILCNSLFQNIKRLYPNSKTVFVVDKPWLEVAKYQKDVDEVCIFDKRGKNKGLLGILSFIKSFPYKKIDYLFKVYDNDRVNILSWLMKPKKIIGKPYDGDVKVQERHNNLLKKITDAEIINYPIIYNADDNIPQNLQGVIFKNKNYIAICPCSSSVEKNMPIETVVELVDRINNEGYEVIIVGVGNEIINYTRILESKNCNFINLANKTRIYELAQVLRNCKGLISTDTGTMHFSYANNVPTVCVFYENDYVKYWAPMSDLYPYTAIPDNVSAEGIYKSFKELQKKYLIKEVL